MRLRSGLVVAVLASSLGGVTALVLSFLMRTDARSAQAARAEPSTRPAVDPTGMVFVPGGVFTMGTDDPRSMRNERPARSMRIEGFWIDARDVTNRDFRKFVDATGYLTTAEKGVDWEVWIDQGDKPFPRKLVIVDRTDPAKPTFIARLDWKMNPSFADSDFKFVPGPDSKRIKLASYQGAGG